MASRSSSSTHSPRASMSKPAERSRADLPRRGRASASAEPQPRSPGPSEKKHESLAQVRQTGRQSDQGGRPGRNRSAS